jgi:methylenetetrahydrofolate dehydrogenase (NADP+)/methenyltetrahydrofolate cyclohydrolase
LSSQKLATILDGKHVASIYKQSLKEKINVRLKQGLRPPGLAVILVGNDAASSIYVNHKQKACVEYQVYSDAYHLSEDTSEETLLSLINTLNQTDTIDGILVQLPLPKHIDTQKIIEHIQPEKDVDGFHPYNLGRLAQGNPTLRPCTPLGIITLLKHYQLPIQGKHAVVIGASNIVGRPMGLELLLEKATVTICHSATQSLETHVREAELLVVAAGVLDVVKPEWLNRNQVVVDVGMHRLQDGTLRGDVDFHAAKHRVAWLTPVPFGIGPMTICMLLYNTYQALTSRESAN